jgi:transposase
VAAARHAVAVELVADLRRLDDQLRDTKQRITVAVAASRTTVTDVFGVGPIVAAIVIGDVGDIGRSRSRDAFAAYNGTGPIEVSSGRRKIYRLSRCGDRRRSDPRGEVRALVIDSIPAATTMSASPVAIITSPR